MSEQSCNLTEYQRLCSAIAMTIVDYREGEIPQPTAEHVARWVEQFPEAARVPILQEMDRILSITYFSRERVENWLRQLSRSGKIAGDCAAGDFWAAVRLLRLQRSGESQKEMCDALTSVVESEYGFVVGSNSVEEGPFVYLDDFVFTGNTAIRDIARWIRESAPRSFELHVVAIATHSYGEYYLGKRLDEVSAEVSKEMSLKIWRSCVFEDKRINTDVSEVIRPTSACGDVNVNAYVAKITASGFPPVLRSPSGMPKRPLFASIETRDVFEKQLLRAGAGILQKCESSNPLMRPLGYSRLETLGFGAMVSSYLNCPNNCPLALWWGDPSVSSGALAWYPLLPRRTAVND